MQIILLKHATNLLTKIPVNSRISTSNNINQRNNKTWFIWIIQ